MHVRTAVSLFVLLFLVLAPAAPAFAQAVAVGPRLSFVRPDPALGTASDRYTGGLVRMGLSPKTAIEVAMDLRSSTNDAGTERVRDTPFQGSVLIYPVRSAISPYVLGGVGWYSQRVQALDPDLDGADAVLEEATTRKFGYHAGFGGEVRVSRRVGVFADYRYTFIRFGDDDTETALGAGAGETGGFNFLPGMGTLLDRFKLSHKGSMWTAGVAVYF